MSRSRKILLIIVALAVLADFLPTTRDELSWYWANAHNHADDYLNYMSDWPKGRHVAEARLAAVQRRWAESKREQILQAYALASHANANLDNAYRVQKAARRDTFFWQHATNENTVASYNRYLHQFPQGSHVAEALRNMAVPGLPAAEAETNQTTPQ